VATIQVLCVDDSADVLEVLRFLLNRTPDLACVGSIITADNLPEEVSRSGADVVLLDLGIPGCDTLERLRELKGSGVAAKAIVFSGDCEYETVEKSLNAGADACVRKGSDPHTLIETIRRVAEHRHAA
jgi:DNA-binding NarL/FixJ family response regulator